MIIAVAFLLFAVNSVIFVVTGDWLNGISALAFAVTWGALAIRRGNRKVDRLIQEAAPRSDTHPGPAAGPPPVDLVASGQSQLLVLNPDEPGAVRSVLFHGTATVQLGPDRKDDYPWSTEPAPLRVVIPEGETRAVSWSGEYHLVEEKS